MPSTDDVKGGNERPAAPDALGIAGRTVSGPLSQALYAIAWEQSDEEVESADLGVWAGLLRDAEAAADRVPETSLAGDAEIRPEEIDAGELSGLRASTGMIVTRDVEGNVAVRTFTSLDELAAAWSAILVGLGPSDAGAATVRAAESGDAPI
jgi:hypothetical protein